MNKKALSIMETLDNIFLDIERVETLNNIVSEIGDTLASDNCLLANKIYSLSYSNNMLLKQVSDKINNIYKIVSSINKQDE